MICAVNIGNTNCSVVIFKGSKIIARARFLPSLKNARVLMGLHKKYCFHTVIIAGVVPVTAHRLASCFEKIPPVRVYTVGKNIKIPMRSVYKQGNTLGVDRLLCAYAAYRLYGGPAIVIDAGTAITIDAVSRNGVFWGGMIIPGLQMSLDALHMKTALLPRCKLDAPAELLGLDTKSCMRSGVVRGSAYICTGAIQDYKKKLGSKATVIATGGNAELLKRYSNEIILIDRDLVFQGMRLLLNG